ncbi:MAG TPA: hypothetical protein PLU53_11805 [Bacteroidia bacterium]|nr:hypothetical protein [Bacteroidia bacterium]
MQSNPEERILIERYLNGSLSGLELQQFMERLESDESFRRTVSFQNLLQEGILLNDDERIRKNLVQATRYKKSRIPFGLKLIFTFLIITFIGIIVWDYVGTNSNNSKRHIFSFSFLKNKPEIKEEIETAKSPAVKQESGNVSNSQKEVETPAKANKPDHPSPSETQENAGEKSVISEGEGIAVVDTTGTIENLQPEFVIKKDQLMITYTLQAVEKNSSSGNVSGQENEVSLSQNAVDKLNPAAGLVEKQVPASSYEVEFWLSPINYRGYKLISHRLVLFGIEEPDAVKLIKIDGSLFMKYGDDFYRMWPGSEFMAFKKIREADLPISLK